MPTEPDAESEPSTESEAVPSTGTALRLVMFGTKDFARPTFQKLLETGHHILALVTQPDRPQGRKQEIIPAPIRLDAEAHSLPVLQPEDVNEPEAIARIAEFAPDILVTAAYGQILAPDLLATARFGGINLHGSILPAYRGASPVARAILNGETETGVTVIQMNAQVDAGGMIAIASTPIDPDETTEELEARLAQIGAPLIVEALERIAAGTVQIITQDASKATKAPKLRKEHGLIRWDRPARAVHNQIRAMRPWPIASTQAIYASNPDKPLRVLIHQSRVLEPTDDDDPNVDRQAPASTEPGAVLDGGKERLLVACGEGAIEVLTIQTPGKKPMTAAEFQRGRRLGLGDRLVSS